MLEAVACSLERNSKVASHTQFEISIKGFGVVRVILLETLKRGLFASGKSFEDAPSGYLSIEPRHYEKIVCPKDLCPNLSRERPKIVTGTSPSDSFRF